MNSVQFHSYLLLGGLLYVLTSCDPTKGIRSNVPEVHDLNGKWISLSPESVSCAAAVEKPLVHKLKS